MNYRIEFRTLLPASERMPAAQVELVALLSLGMVEALSYGLISATDALRTWFHAENCLYVRQQLRNRTADEIMSRGTQLPNLFDTLPPLVAQREFQHELAKLHALCLALLEEKVAAA